MTVDQRKFIHALADYLVGNEALMSIKLQQQEPEAFQWQAIRATTPLQGYYPGRTGLERASRELIAFLGLDPAL